MSQTWNIDPSSGDYVIDSKGKPEVVTNLKVPAYIRLKTRRGRWLYAPDDLYGSDFHLVGRKVTAKDNNLVEAIVDRALAPMISDGRASEVEQVPQEYTRHTASISINITDSQGEVEQLTFSPIGVR